MRKIKFYAFFITLSLLFPQKKTPSERETDVNCWEGASFGHIRS